MLKDFDQSLEFQTTAKKSLQFYMFPNFFIQTERRFCYMEVGWKSKDEYIYRFITFS